MNPNNNYSHRFNQNPNGQSRWLWHALLWFFLALCILIPVFAEPAPDLFREGLQPVDYVQTVIGWACCGQNKDGHTLGTARNTGSMEPAISGGDKILLRPFKSIDQIHVGSIILFDRGDCDNVLHMVTAISHTGRAVYTSGIANRYSDGWISTAKIHAIAVRIVYLKGK